MLKIMLFVAIILFFVVMYTIVRTLPFMVILINKTLLIFLKIVKKLISIFVITITAYLLYLTILHIIYPNWKNIFLLPIISLPMKGPVFIFELGIFITFIIYLPLTTIFVHLFMYKKILKCNNEWASKIFFLIYKSSFFLNSLLLFTLLTVKYKIDILKLLFPFLSLFIPQEVREIINASMSNSVVINKSTWFFLLIIPFLFLLIADIIHGKHKKILKCGVVESANCRN